MRNARRTTKKFSRHLKWILPLAGLVIIVAMITALSVTVLSYDKIYPGVYVGHVPLGGLTREEATTVLQENYINAFQDRSISLNYNGNRVAELDLTGNVQPDLAQTLDRAYNAGRTGKGLGRVLQPLQLRFKQQDVALAVTYDSAYIDSAIRNFTDEVEKDNLFFELADSLDSVKITLKENQKVVDSEATKDVLVSRLQQLSFAPVEAVMTEGELTPELIASRINREPVDATCEVVNNETKITPHVVGIKVDENVLREKWNAGEKEFEVPLEKTMPKVTTDAFRKSMFQDVLGECTTYYNGSIVGRTKNVSLASGSINGTVIAPGHDFSFNKVVGERTAERGYMEGIVYVNGRMEDGLGGGICQVSSTLYTAQLYADLQTVSRRNHMFTVSYLPAGQDATVAYGAQDYVFRNSTEYPIKITTSMGGGKLTIKILGTKQPDAPKITIVNNIVSTTPFEEKVEIDNSLAPGERVVKQNGTQGMTVDSYKVYWQGGKEVKRVFLHRSVYSPADKIIQESPLKPSTEPSAEPTKEPSIDVSATPEPSAEPSVQPSVQPEPSASPELPVEPEQSPVPSIDPNIPTSENGL